MLNNVDKMKLVKKIKELHHGWSDAGLEVYTNELLQNCDDRFEGFITQYIDDGVETDFEFGEFSLKEIKALMKSDYIDAIMAMSKYIENPAKGKRNILRPVLDRR